MYPSSSVHYDLAQARIADLRHQARREGLARTVARSAGPGRPLIPVRLRLRSVLPRRAAATAG